ncbi:MAG: protoporphyrinogen oxidase [Bacteriovoracaceae bacterium]
MTSSHSTVIGGGISGLATAWWLRKQGITVSLFEQESTVGGTMKTIRKNGWLIETGPNSALETSPLCKTLFEDVGIADELVYANPAGNNRYILRGGKLHPLPMSPGLFFRSRLWSLRGKLRLLKEPFVGKATKEESIAEFVERRLGREFLDYAINPFVAGIFAGAPESLSVRAAFPKLYALEEKYGGLIRGQIGGARERKKRGEVAKDRARMFSFKNGMQTLPDGIAAALGTNIRTSTKVERIEYDRKEKLYTLHFSINGSPGTHRSQSVIFAVPAAVAARLISPFDNVLSQNINNIVYPPVTEVFVGYKTDQVRCPLDGFGFLIPEKEQRQILGAIWSSTLFDGRVPEGCVALTVFIGGSRQPEYALRNDVELLQTVNKELNDILNIDGDPVFTQITRWQMAIPQYHLGHLQIVQLMEKFEERYPGVFLSGNYRDGISVGDCIIQSDKMSRRAADFLASQKL